MDKLYNQLQRMKSAPQLFLACPLNGLPDLFGLRNFIAGFCTREDGLVEYSSITGFTEYVANKFHENDALDWASIIHRYVSNADAFKTFYNLYDQYVELKQQRGILDDPPPHFQIGGVYKYVRFHKQYILIVLDFQVYSYLIAVTDISSDKDECIINYPDIKRHYSFGWEFVPTMITPSEVVKLGNIEVKGDFSKTGRIIKDNRWFYIENVASNLTWTNNSVFKANLSLREVSNAEDLELVYQRLKQKQKSGSTEDDTGTDDTGTYLLSSKSAREQGTRSY